MDYRGRKIDIHSKNLMQFIRQLAAGEFLIPTFQRLFVWRPEDISNLWDSIFHCYPVGSIMCWQTSVKLHVHRRLGGFYIPENGGAQGDQLYYILDGQQRATSLLVSFWGGSGKIKEHISFDYTLYFDLSNASFFFQKDYYRHRWEVDAAFLLRLKDVPELDEDYCGRLRSLRGYSPSVEANLQQLRYVLDEYNIPLITLQGYDIEGVCAIYERINQTGMRLENMDILIARGFRNYATVVEEDFPVVPE